MSHSQTRPITKVSFLHMHGLIFRRTLQNWQDQPGKYFVFNKIKK